MRHAGVCALLVIGCGHQGADQPDGPGAIDAPPGDIDSPPTLDKSGGCVNNFGNTLTDGFGRLDGTIVAVLAPGNTSCAKPNSTHLVIEIRGANNQVNRIVATTISTVGNPVMALAERDVALVGPAWSAGWHTGFNFDFVTNLGLHRLDFAPTDQDDLVYQITNKLQVGSHVSVFGTSQNEPDSAHLIHRNFTNQDGAIVIDPDTAPHYMMMRFDNQLF